MIRFTGVRFDFKRHPVVVFFEIFPAVDVGVRLWPLVDAFDTVEDLFFAAFDQGVGIAVDIVLARTIWVQPFVVVGHWVDLANFFCAKIGGRPGSEFVRVFDVALRS